MGYSRAVKAAMEFYSGMESEWGISDELVERSVQLMAAKLEEFALSECNDRVEAARSLLTEMHNSGGRVLHFGPRIRSVLSKLDISVGVS